MPSDETRKLLKLFGVAVTNLEDALDAGKASADEIVKWDQDPGDGANEPEHPAPVLKLTPKGTAPAGTGVVAASAKTPVSAASPQDGTARLLGGLGIAAGVIGIGVGGFGLNRARLARTGSRS